MEEISNLNIAITTTTPSGLKDVGRVAYLSRSFESHQGVEQLVGSSPERLQIVTPTPAFVYIRNIGASIVFLDSIPSMIAFPQRILPGNSLCLAPQTDTIWVNTIRSGAIWVMSVN